MAINQSLWGVVRSLNGGREHLSAFQRVLLTTDGTVTHVLEAFADEAICVVKLAPSFEHQASTGHGMELLANERVMHRSVLLQGAISRTNFLRADSLIVQDRLPTAVLQGLLTTDEPIGRLLVKHRVESFREIEGVRFEPAAECAEYFGVDPGDPFVFRTYQIYIRQRPVIRITEGFPTAWFRAQPRLLTPCQETMNTTPGQMS
jgi:chorismate-pyruvate lyase